ncbi:MAG: hypothetical protein ACYS0G_10290 [Planctomycetota bacterium]|jgi:hypothetical protein
MSLRPLTDHAEIADAFKLMKSRLERGARRYKRHVGFQGGGAEFDIYWRATERIWVLLDPDVAENRYRCCFGLQHPSAHESLAITCEINPPHEGIDRKIAGVFLRDDRGVIHVAHSGKIGGGRAGIGKTAFLAAYRGDNIEPVEWADGVRSKAIVVGAIDAREFPSQLAHFVREVERFKAVTAGGAAR